MNSLTLLPMLVAIIASSLVQIFTDPRITKAFINKSIVALLVYGAHLAVGIGVTQFLLPQGPDTAAGITVALLGWIGLGGLGLVRLAPRLREPPQVLLHFGIADGLCLMLIAGGLLQASGALA
jgi:hypothetical protein